MRNILVFGFSAFFFLSSCGTTKITAGNQDADIYLDSRKIGKGSAEIPQTGIPAKRTLTAKYNGGVIGSMEIKRRFTATTAVAGLFTFYTGFIWAWQYPDMVFIPTEPVEKTKKNSWDEPPSKWNK